MCEADNEKGDKKNNGRNRTTKCKKASGHLEKNKIKRTWEYLKITSSKRNGRKRKERGISSEVNLPVVSLERYSRPFLNWTTWMDQRIRNLMMIYKALHPKDHIGRLYVSGKEGGRRTTSIEDGVAATIQELEEYITKNKKMIIRHSSERPGFNSRSHHTKDFKKWYLIPPCLALSDIRYVLT